jgi:hypothetical protein
MGKSTQLYVILVCSRCLADWTVCGSTAEFGSAQKTADQLHNEISKNVKTQSRQYFPIAFRIASFCREPVKGTNIPENKEFFSPLPQSLLPSIIFYYYSKFSSPTQEKSPVRLVQKGGIRPFLFVKNCY